MGYKAIEGKIATLRNNVVQFTQSTDGSEDVRQSIEVSDMVEEATEWVDAIGEGIKAMTELHDRFCRGLPGKYRCNLSFTLILLGQLA